jgi:hypothetical protein
MINLSPAPSAAARLYLGKVTQQRDGRCMQEEAEIAINGVRLSDSESMTVRVAIDTLANVLAAGIDESEGRELSEVYLTALSSIQNLLDSRQSRKQ